MRRCFSLPPANRDRRGVAAIEFAMVAPLLILMMLGIVVYGGWFWMAHSVQSLASEGARAAIAGLDPAERETLARDFIGAQVGDLGLRADRASVEVESTASIIRVNVVYDARDHPLMALSAIVPSPPPTIRRTAVVRLGDIEMPRPRWLEDQKGGVAVMSAAFAGLMCVLAALAVDLGAISLKARKIQGAADLSAMAAAHDLTHAESAARATAAANLTDLQTVGVTKGGYAADPRLKPEDRFRANASEPNAARVEVTAPAPLFFGRWILKRDSISVRKTATAAIPGGRPQAMFSIGSRLASLDGGLANALLSSLLGGNVSLTVIDYRALAGARVNLLQFSDALAADLGVTAGDYDALLNQEVTAGRALKVLESIAGSDTKSVLGKLTRTPADARLRLKDLIGVEADAKHGLREALNADVSALDLIMASLETANGDRQVALDLGARAGLADLDVMLAIGERPNKSPWLTITGKDDPIIRTAQARIYLKATTTQALAGLAQVKLPVLVEAAASEARLKRINCEGARTVTLAVRPGVARARIGAIDESRLKNFKAPLTSSPATLVSALNLVTVKAHADVEIADLTWQEAVFNTSDISNHTVKSVRSRGFVNGLIVSLLQRTEVSLLGLDLGGLVQAVGALLTPLGPVLDGIVQPLLDLLGLKLGEADVRVHGLQCPTQGRTPVLVG